MVRTLANLTLIFERLRSYGLQLKSTKCHLFRSSVPFLGHIVGHHGLECDPAKIDDVRSWPVPDCLKDCLKSVRQFLGFVGYYRRFIPRFADVATLLVHVKSMLPELRSLWHHRNNLSVDDNGTLWRKRSSQNALLQLLVPKAGRERLFLFYHASLYGGHLGRTQTLARLADRFYWSGMSDDVKDWLGQCVACIKRKSPVGRHHPLGNIPTGHRWDRIAMDILDVCDPTPEGFRYILVIDDYFGKWTEAFPMKNKCADTVADILVENIILRFGMPWLYTATRAENLRMDL